MKTFYWLVKREFWEHRGGFFWAPIITGGIFLLLNIMGIITAEVLGARQGISFGASGGLRKVIEGMDAGDMSKVGFALDIAMYSAMGLLVVVLNELRMRHSNSSAQAGVLFAREKVPA